jgi:hypothetical protein
VPGIFDDDGRDDIESAYINQVIPQEAAELWDASVANSPVWDSYSPEDHMFLADQFADAVFSGDFDIAEDFLDYLEIEWDAYDVHQFWEAYEALTG